MKQLVPLVLLGLGAVLTLASFALPAMSGARTALSEEDYARLEQLEEKVVELHIQMQSVKRRTGNQDSPEEGSPGFNKIVEERDALRAKLEGNIEKPQTAGTFLRYAGIGVLVVGVIAHLALKPS